MGPAEKKDEVNTVLGEQRGETDKEQYRMGVVMYTSGGVMCEDRREWNIWASNGVTL